MVFDVTQMSQPTVTFVKKNQRLFSCKIRFFKFKFPSIRRTVSKYNVEQQTRGQILCKNIHAFLRNCGFRVGAFYFDAQCRMIKESCREYDVFLSWMKMRML